MCYNRLSFHQNLFSHKELKCLVIAPPPAKFRTSDLFRKLTFPIALLALLFANSSALADGHGRGDFYVGGGVSSVRDADACPLDYDGDIPAAVSDSDATGTFSVVHEQSVRGKCEDKERGYKIFAGYRAHENFGAEFGYLAADGFDIAADLRFFDLPNTRTHLGDLTADTDASLFYLAGVGYYPVSEQFSLLGKAGVHRYKKETTVNYDSDTDTIHDKFNVKVKDDGIGFLAGIGAQYDFAALPLSLRGEYEYARLDSDTSLRLLSFSVLWRF